MIRVVGLAIAFAVVAAAIILGGNVAIFINVPSALMVLGITFGLLLHTYGGEIRALADPAHPQRAQVAATGAHFALVSGGICTVIGIVSMLATLDDPSRAGGGMALALLALLYGGLLSEFFFMPMARGNGGGSEPQPSVDTLASAGRAFVGLVVLGALVIMLVLMGSFTMIAEAEAALLR